ELHITKILGLASKPARSKLPKPAVHSAFHTSACMCAAAGKSVIADIFETDFGARRLRPVPARRAHFPLLTCWPHNPQKPVTKSRLRCQCIDLSFVWPDRPAGAVRPQPARSQRGEVG